MLILHFCERPCYNHYAIRWREEIVTLKGHRNTISLSVMRGIMLFLIPINVLLSAYSLFSWSVLRTQARENYSNYLSIVAQQADNELSNLFTWMRGVFYNNTYIRQIQFANNDISRFLSAQEVNQDASTYLDQYPNPMAFLSEQMKEYLFPLFPRLRKMIVMLGFPNLSIVFIKYLVNTLWANIF